MQKFNIKPLYTTILMAITAIPLASNADEDHDHHESHHEYLEEVVVSAPFNKTAAETAQPVNILAGEALVEEVANTLGETLQDEIGINNASFGPAVGHPVIRGHTGNRVGVLQNGVGTTDVSNQSPDHAEAVEVSLADRIEIIRGPSSLLYGSGKIGGVINVIDGKIPETVPEKPEFMIEQTHNENNSENRTVFRIDAGSGNFAFHLEGFRRDSDNVEIPGFAIDEASVEALEELLHDEHEHEDEHHDEHEEEGEHHEEEGEHHEDEHDDEHGHEEEELPNTFGFVGNSDAESEGGAVGFSFIGDRGFIGFSASRLDNEYGLPPGSHTHAHDHEEEEEHHDEEEGEHHEEEGEHHEEGEEHEDEHGHGGEEVEFVRLAVEKTRYDMRMGLDFENGMFESVRGSFAYTDYEHDEVEYLEDGDQVVGTTFSNEGYEGRISATRRATGAWSGVYGFQFTDNEFSAVGEEAFIPVSDIRNLGVFGFERYEGDQFNVEIGLRYESNDVETGRCESSESELSASGSVLYDINEQSNVFFGLSRASRTPSVEELFANVDNTTCANPADPEDLVFHAATNLLEIGNPNMGSETSNNIEVGYRYQSEVFTAEISAYVNRIDDYIYLNLTGEEFEEQLIGRFVQQDADFTGVEARLGVNLYDSDDLSILASVFGDATDADFDAGGNVPLIPAAKVGAELEFFGEQWTFHVHAINVTKQDDVGEFELETDGYNEISIYADYHWDLGSNGELKLFFKGNNLLDEEIRTHASRLKNYAPEPGRNFQIGLRFNY